MCVVKVVKFKRISKVHKHIDLHIFNMVTIFGLILSFTLLVMSGQLINTPDGLGQFITGRGCGVTTPIKYLNYIPENLDKFECSFVHAQENLNPPIKFKDCKTPNEHVKNLLKFTSTIDVPGTVLPTLN